MSCTHTLGVEKLSTEPAGSERPPVMCWHVPGQKARLVKLHNPGSHAVAHWLGKETGVGWGGGHSVREGKLLIGWELERIVLEFLGQRSRGANAPFFNKTNRYQQRLLAGGGRGRHVWWEEGVQGLGPQGQSFQHRRR